MGAHRAHLARHTPRSGPPIVRSVALTRTTGPPAFPAITEVAKSVARVAKRRERSVDRQAKRQQILSGAKALFREVGYERASVDAIAARAGVSKATIYNHFRSKEALFFCAYSSETERLRETFLGLLEAPTGDIESDLHQIGKELLRLVCAPSNVLHHRVVIGEAGRFPELGQALYDCGLRAGRERMTCFFERAGALGLLEMDDPASAAVNFAALVLGDLFKELQLAVRQDVSEQVIDENVRRGVRTFLRAYLPFSSRTEYIGAALSPTASSAQPTTSVDPGLSPRRRGDRSRHR